MKYEQKRGDLITVVKSVTVFLLSAIGVVVAILLLFKGKSASKKGKQQFDELTNTVEEEFDNFSK